MKKNKGLMFLCAMLLVSAFACNFPAITPTLTPSPDIDATVTAFALTQGIVETQLPTSTDFITVTVVLTPVTPTITSTVPPSVPMVSVSVDTNCRTGPGVVYDRLTGLFVGETAEVIGKYTAVTPNYWIIRKGTTTCWLWGQYATVTGNTANLPEMVPPPSPTPTKTPTQTITPTITQTGTPTSTPTITNTP